MNLVTMALSHSIKSLKKCQPAIAEKQTLSTRHGGPTRWDSLFYLCQKGQKWPSQASQVVSTDESRYGHAVSPFGCIHLPPPILPFLLKQNISQRTLAEVTSWSWKSH